MTGEYETDEYPIEDDPLFRAIDDLGEIDEEWVAKRPKAADSAIEKRMRRLRLAATAVAEILARDDPVTPEAIQNEMDRIRDEFVFHGRYFVDLSELLREDGDDTRADIVDRAILWHQMKRAAEEGETSPE